MAKVLDKARNLIEGIFTGDETVIKSPINTPEQQKIVDMVIQDYQYFKAQRQKIEGVWKQEQRFYKGDHWHGLRPPEVSKMRPNSIDNVAWSQIESMVAKLAGWMPYPDFEGQEDQDEQKAEDLNAFMPYELRCIGFKQKHIRAVRRMVIHGPIAYKTIYDPTVEGGYGMNKWDGQNDIIPMDLGSFFPDPRIKDFIYLQKAAAHIIHTRHPQEYFEDRWPAQGEKVKDDYMSGDVYIFDQDDTSQNGFSTDRSTSDGTGSEIHRPGLIEYWYKGKPKMMSSDDKKLFKETADDKLKDGIDPSEWQAKSKGTMKGIHCVYISTGGVFLEHKSYVYDHGQYPFTIRTLFPDEDNPWGKGYMRDMMSPQIMMNKFAEIAVETMAKQGNGAIAYEEDAISKPQVWKERRSMPGAMLPVNDISRFKELQGINVPNTVFQMLGHYKDMMQKIPGQFDSANGQANPDVNSGEQAKALIAASSGRLGLASEIIEDALQEVFMQYIMLMAQFYNQERIARVTGRQVSISRDKLVNRVLTTYETGKQIPHPETGAMMPEQVPVMEEYVPKYDINVNIGVEKPKDREYNIQMAFNLFKMINPATQMPFVDEQAVMYTVENGRMEPFSVIEARMQSEQQQMQQMQQLQQQVEQDQQEIAVLNKQIEMLGGHIQESEQNNMQATADTLKHLNDGQKMDHEQQMKQQEFAHRQQMDRANAQINAAKVAQMGQRQAVGGQ